MKTNIEVSEKDLSKIGHSACCALDGSNRTSILCNVETSNIEEMFLRSILKCFDEEYTIDEINDHVETLPDGEEHLEIEFIISMPFDKYHKCIR